MVELFDAFTFRVVYLLAHEWTTRHDTTRRQLLATSQDKNLAPGVDLSAIARQTPGAFGAVPGAPQHEVMDLNEFL